MKPQALASRCPYGVLLFGEQECLSWTFNKASAKSHEFDSVWKLKYQSKCCCDALLLFFHQLAVVFGQLSLLMKLKSGNIFKLKYPSETGFFILSRRFCDAELCPECTFRHFLSISRCILIFWILGVCSYQAQSHHHPCSELYFHFNNSHGLRNILHELNLLSSYQFPIMSAPQSPPTDDDARKCRQIAM